jgi:hypothetical protein
MNYYNIFTKYYNYISYWTCSICFLKVPQKYRISHIKSRKHKKQEFIKNRILETIVE